MFRGVGATGGAWCAVGLAASSCAGAALGEFDAGAAVALGGVAFELLAVFHGELVAADAGYGGVVEGDRGGQVSGEDRPYKVLDALHGPGWGGEHLGRERDLAGGDHALHGDAGRELREACGGRGGRTLLGVGGSGRARVSVSARSQDDGRGEGGW